MAQMIPGSSDENMIFPIPLFEVLALRFVLQLCYGDVELFKGPTTNWQPSEMQVTDQQTIKNVSWSVACISMFYSS